MMNSAARSGEHFPGIVQARLPRLDSLCKRLWRAEKNTTTLTRRPPVTVFALKRTDCLWAGAASTHH